MTIEIIIFLALSLLLITFIVLLSKEISLGNKKENEIIELSLRNKENKNEIYKLNKKIKELKDPFKEGDQVFFKYGIRLDGKEYSKDPMTFISYIYSRNSYKVITKDREILEIPLFVECQKYVAPSEDLYDLKFKFEKDPRKSSEKEWRNICESLIDKMIEENLLKYEVLESSFENIDGLDTIGLTLAAKKINK